MSIKKVMLNKTTNNRRVKTKKEKFLTLHSEG